MRISIVTMTIVSAAALALTARSANAFDYSTYKDFARTATECEHEGKWLQIHWLKNMEQAKVKAKAENKPILVFLVIGFHGQKNADDC